MRRDRKNFEERSKQSVSHKQESWQPETVWILNELSGQRRGKIIELLPMNDKDGSGALWERRHPVYLAAIALGGSWTGTQWQWSCLVSDMHQRRWRWGKWKSVQPRRSTEEERSTRKFSKGRRKNPWVCAELLMKCLLMSSERISSCQLSQLGKAPQDQKKGETVPRTKATKMQRELNAFLGEHF